MYVDHKGSKFGILCRSCNKKGKYHKMEINRELDFTTNWNNKLNCDCFTTLRLFNPIKHCVGNRFSIRLRGFHKGYANLIAVRTILLDGINDFAARLDTGYSAKECQEVIRTMYKNKRIDWKTQRIAFCLLQYDKNEREPQLFNE